MAIIFSKPPQKITPIPPIAELNNAYAVLRGNVSIFQSKLKQVYTHNLAYQSTLTTSGYAINQTMLGIKRQLDFIQDSPQLPSDTSKKITEQLNSVSVELDKIYALLYTACSIASKKNNIGPIIVSLQGTTILPKERILLARPEVGGVVLYTSNWEKTHTDPKSQLKKLIQEIRSLNANLIIMVDHEGGKVWRFEQGFTKIPSAKTFGQLYDADKTKALKDVFEAGRTMAEELLECDVDLSLAPVLDLDGPNNIIGKQERAFHRDPKVVAELAEQFILGMRASGMPATAKHFPGHGSCVLDSHVAMPVDGRTLVELQNDLHPFKTLVQKKLLGAVMPAHITYPAVDPDNTAGFSLVWNIGYLRGLWGFEGVIMSDCLSMKGADIGPALARLQAAQKAGCDFLMLTHQHDEALDTLLSVLTTRSAEIQDTEEAARRRMLLAEPVIDYTKISAVTTAVATAMSENTAPTNIIKLTLGYLYHAKTKEKQTQIEDQIKIGLSA